MHEFGITSRIVAAVSRVASENGATRVIRVDLLIGQLTFLSPQQVKLAYDLLVKGTPLEGSELAIQASEGLVECRSCRHQREVKVQLPEDPNSFTDPLPLFACSECGGKVDVIKGKECEVTGIAIDS